MKKISVFVGAMLVLGWTTSSDAELVFTIEQVGSNVVATGSGNADLAALTVIPTEDHSPPTIVSSIGLLAIGATGNQPYMDVDTFMEQGVEDKGRTEPACGDVPGFFFLCPSQQRGMQGHDRRP